MMYYDISGSNLSYWPPFCATIVSDRPRITQDIWQYIPINKERKYFLNPENLKICISISLNICCINLHCINAASPLVALCSASRTLSLGTKPTHAVWPAMYDCTRWPESYKKDCLSKQFCYFCSLIHTSWVPLGAEVWCKVNYERDVRSF